MPSKTCSRCDLALPATSEFFYKEPRVPSGLAAACKNCHYQAVKKWRSNHRDVMRGYDRKYRRDDPERVEERVRRWRERNPEKARAIKRRLGRDRDARQRGALVERVDDSIVLQRADGRCGICRLRVDPNRFHVDHIVPLSRGGLHSYDNTQPSHPKCNTWKHNRLEAELPPIPVKILRAALMDHQRSSEKDRDVA